MTEIVTIDGISPEDIAELLSLAPARIVRVKQDCWRAIEDAPYGDTLLLYVPGTGVTVGHLSSGEFVIDILNDCRETYATHWMPLPGPPIEAGAEAPASPS